MTKKQKQQLRKALFVAAGLFFLYVVIFINIIPDAETSQFVLNQIEWTTKLVDNFSSNSTFYISVAALLGIFGYFSLAKKRK